jgi:hypothetical protein
MRLAAGVLSEVKADDGSILYHRNEQLQRAAAPADAAMQQMDASASGALEEDVSWRQLHGLLGISCTCLAGIRPCT